jgi:acyl-CoA-binding protein
MAGISVMLFKQHERERAAAEKDRERKGQMVTAMCRDDEENINAKSTSTTDEQDPTNAIEIELLQDVANEISNRFLTFTDSITTVSDDSSHFFGIDEYELEQDGFGVYGLESQEDDFVADPNPFCAELESMGKFVCCFADTILDDKSIDSFRILERDVDLPEDKPSGRFFFMNKSDSLNRNDDKVILNENGGNNKGILKENDVKASSNENRNGSQSRKEDNTIVNVGGSNAKTSIKEKVPATGDECLLPAISIFERLNSGPGELKAIPSESKIGRQNSFKRRTSEAKNESGKIDLDKGSNETEVDTETLVAVEVELGELVEPTASERKFGQEKSLQKRTNKARTETGKSRLQKGPKETEMASDMLIAAEFVDGESVKIGDVGEPKIVESNRKFELWERLKEKSKNKANEPKIVESKRKFDLWKRLKEKSKDKADNESGENGLQTVSNESDVAIEMLIDAEGGNGESGNAQSGMMRMLDNALLPKNEDASYKPSLRIANAREGARPDMYERRTSTKDASRTDDEPETSKLADVVLADDLSLVFESNALLNVGGGDANASIQEKVPSTDDECLLPGVVIHKRLNFDVGEPKVVPSESNGPEKSFKKRTSEAKDESGKIDLEKGSNETEVDTETLVAVEVEIGDLAEPNAEPVASERKIGQEKRLKKRKKKARNETGKSGLQKVSKETEMASETLIAAEVTNGESLEIGDVGEPKVLESNRKFELWKRLKEKSKNKADNESGKNGLQTVSNESDVAIEMLIAAEGGNGESRNAESGMMRMLDDALLPKNEFASYKPSLRIANARKGARPDMYERRTSTEDASRTEDPETSKLADVVLADDLSLIFESNALLNVGGGDANACKQEKVPSTDDECLLPGVVIHKRLNFDAGEPKVVPSKSKVGPEKSFKKRTSVAKDASGKIDLEKGSSETEVDAETLVVIDVKIGDPVEPKAVPVASERKSGLKKSLKNRKTNAKSESGKTGLEKVSKETEMTANEESVEICDISEPKIIESKRKSELWKRQKTRKNKSKSKSGTIGLKKSSEGTKVASETKLATKNASRLSESRRSFERVIANTESLRVQESDGSWSTTFLESMRMLESVLLPDPEEASHHPSLDDTLRVSNGHVPVGKQKDVRPDISVGSVSTDDASQTDDEAEASKLAEIVLANDLSLIFEKPVWKATVDPSTGLPYFYHRLTRVTTWTAPPGFIEQ